MEKSLRQIALEMNPTLGSHDAIALSDVFNQHHWPAGFPVSGRRLREVFRRHTDAITVRFLSYNTFLTEGDVKLPDPFPNIRMTAKPALHIRAREIGNRVKLDYDFASLYEVMQFQQRDEILANWDPSLPDNFFGGTLSSVFTISTKFNIVRQAIRHYANKGKATRVDVVPIFGPSVDVSFDSDFYADKAVMLTAISTPHGEVEVYSSHLFFGGGLPDFLKSAINAATPFENHLSESDLGERAATRLAEIDELIDFYRENHHEDSVAIICGDFNIDGSDPIQFQNLKARLALIGFKDAWAEGPFPNNTVGGQTTRNDDDETRPIELNFDNICKPTPGSAEFCNDTLGPLHPDMLRSMGDSVGRFDYLFVQDPQLSNTTILDLSRIRRRAFPHDAGTGDQFFLSDHLGLDTTLIVSKKQ